MAEAIGKPVDLPNNRNSGRDIQHIHHEKDDDIPMLDAPSETKGESTFESGSTVEKLHVDGVEGLPGEQKDKTLFSPLEWKNEGNFYFGKENWEKALYAYRSGLTILLHERKASSCSPNHQLQQAAALTPSSEPDPVEIALRSNISYVLLKLKQYDWAEKECNQILSISPGNSKALYRRACALEGLYFTLDKHENNEDNKDNGKEVNTTLTQESSKLELLNAAIRDLQKAMEILEKDLYIQPHQQTRQRSPNNDKSHVRKLNMGMMQQCQRSLDRLRKECDRYENRPKTKRDNFEFTAEKLKQKQDILRLLVARYNDGLVFEGEAYFLLEWNWWVRWCRYVDFFDSSSFKNGKANPNPERAQKLLIYLPPGAILPLHIREDFESGNDEDESSDEEESEHDHDDEYAPPGPIDNNKLLVKPDDVVLQQWQVTISIHATEQQDENLSILKPNLIRGYHFEILPREVYSALRSWYGEKTSPICRRVSDENDIKLYPVPILRSVAVWSEVLPRCNACRAPCAHSRCKLCMMVQYCDRSCQESHWRYHRHHCKSNSGTNHGTENIESFSVPDIPVMPKGGRVGLNNLGNTCFMNSALQSLSHALPLTRHFLSNRFKSDLNLSNPLGTGGKLALAYEDFLKDAWMKHGCTSISPTSLKRAIALFAPRFAGYHQHDSQEFLAYLLDGLHEDLNRIRGAPYVEMPDVTNGQNMRIAAAKAWSAHKRRNDSLVMDTFYGQFQSTCICPRCSKVSVSFDAFNHVSLEIPSVDDAWTTMSIPVLVHFSDGKRKPIRYGVTLPRHGSVFDLKKATSELSNLSVSRLVLTDVYEGSIYKLLDDKQNLTSISPREDFIVAYEVTPYSVEDTLHMIVTHSMGGDTTKNTQHIGLPFMTSIDAKKSSCFDLWKLIRGFVQRFIEVINGTNKVLSNSEHDHEKEILSIQVVNAQGQPRFIFQTSDKEKHTDILPKFSSTLLSKHLGEDCAENFLFLNIIWGDIQRDKTFDPKVFLDFDDDPSLEKLKNIQRLSKESDFRQGVTLDQCFQSFSSPERLDVNNMWYCSKCRTHVQALKTMKLWQLPNILVVHLKRFEFKNALRRDKLSTYVDFPLTGLDMAPHCAHKNVTGNERKFVKGDVPAEYDLFAVVNHYGRLGFGHYTAFAMQWDETGVSNEWNVFDDSSVHRIDSSEVKSSAAYILFYRRRVFH